MIKQTNLYREIHEQPDVLRRLLDSQKGPIEELARAMKKHHIQQVMIAARGTSDNAGVYAKYVLGTMNGLPVAMAAPSLFTIYKHPPRLSNTLVLGISQSGKSPDIVSVLVEAKRQGALTAALTNTPESELAGQADVVIDLIAGEEKAVAATKTYTGELGAIALLSALLADDPIMKNELQAVPEAMSAVLSMNDLVAGAVSRYRYIKQCVVIGRGYNYATAFELSLKLQELVYINAQPYSSADFMHGPLALIDTGFPIIVFAPSGSMFDEMRELIDRVRDCKAEIICITDEPSLAQSVHTPLVLSTSIPEWLSPLTCIMPGQLFALYLAATCGYDVDRPRSIHKITETT